MTGPVSGFEVPGPVCRVAVAGIADPERFLKELAARGDPQCLVFRDHRIHAKDVERIRGRRSGRARAVVTTEKDFVRLLPFRPFPIRRRVLPLTMEPEPAAEFRRWLDASLQAARDITVD